MYIYLSIYLMYIYRLLNMSIDPIATWDMELHLYVYVYVYVGLG